MGAGGWKCTWRRGGRRCSGLALGHVLPLLLLSRVPSASNPHPTPPPFLPPPPRPLPPQRRDLMPASPPITPATWPEVARRYLAASAAARYLSTSEPRSSALVPLQLPGQLPNLEPAVGVVGHDDVLRPFGAGLCALALRLFWLAHACWRWRCALWLVGWLADGSCASFRLRCRASRSCSHPRHRPFTTPTSPSVRATPSPSCRQCGGQALGTCS